ncbi:MAG: hypothetical protein NUV50_12415 [Rhodospirillales bacterium]|nr:hypothetical protein [Rhodospirillales bacterium]
MIWKTALITLVSTLLIAILALRSQQENASGQRMATPAPGWGGDGSAMSVTGASTSWTGSGQRGDWGRYGYAPGAGSGSMNITGASSSYSSGGQRGNWGEHDDDGYGDHDGGGGGDDDGYGDHDGGGGGDDD